MKLSSSSTNETSIITDMVISKFYFDHVIINDLAKRFHTTLNVIDIVISDGSLLLSILYPHGFITEF